MSKALGFETKSIGDLSKRIFGGGTPPRDNPDNYKGQIPWATVKDFDESKLYLRDTQEYISELGLKSSSAKMVTKGNVILPTRMGLGRIMIASIDVAINQDLKAIELDQEIIEPLYFAYWFLSQKAKIETIGSGTTVKGIDLDTLKNLEIPVPKIKEQKKIVEILSTTDQTIDSYTHEIDKKKMVLRGLMPDLVFGTNVSGARIEWENRKVPKSWKMFELGKALTKSERPIDLADDLIYQLVTVKRRHEGVVEREKLLGKNILTKNQFIIKGGDFIISKRQIVHGACELVPNYLSNSVVSNEYDVFQGSKFLDIGFFNWLSKTQEMRNLFSRCSQGVVIEKMIFKTDWWLRHKIALPSLEDQIEIRDILDSANQNLNILIEKRQKYEFLKKALMSDLLTGRVRVA